MCHSFKICYNGTSGNKCELVTIYQVGHVNLKGGNLLLSYFTTFSIFAIISAIIDIFLLKKAKRKAPIANVLFGIHITLIGIFIFL